MRRWTRTTLPRAPFYAARGDVPLHALPVVDKRRMLDDFAAFNTRGIDLATALRSAESAERAGADDARGRDLSFGLSSGTGGPRGVFIASRRERAAWAGILLARVLTPGLLKALLTRGAPLRVAFFLRANNRLYTTLASRRIDFRFFDLTRGIAAHVPGLQAARPDVLVAPASVLAWLAAETLAGRLALAPRHVVSVAEVLEADDAATIGAAFGRVVHQIYQCTEGFIGATCGAGTLHLNEDFVHIEPAWLDAARTRFTPIITDFTRTTQLFVRYRLDDVLRVRTSPCGCGSPLLAIDAVEGRSDDVLWLRSAGDDALTPVFPDAVRHAIARCDAGVGDYRLEQHGDEFHLAVSAADDDSRRSIRAAVDAMVAGQRLVPPAWRMNAFAPDPPSRKRRRIRCVRRP